MLLLVRPLIANINFNNFLIQFSGLIVAFFKFQVMCSTQVKSIGSQDVTVSSPDGQEHLLPADTVLIATGMKANRAMLDRWEALVPDLRVVGDCEHAARIMEATRSGYCAGHTI